MSQVFALLAISCDAIHLEAAERFKLPYLPQISSSQLNSAPRIKSLYGSGNFLSAGTVSDRLVSALPTPSMVQSPPRLMLLPAVTCASGSTPTLDILR